MAANRCGKCVVNYPATSAYTNCPACGAKTMWANSEFPDNKPGEDPDKLATQELPAASPAYVNRVERYLHMGFSEVDAHRLAVVQDEAGFYLYHGDVAKHLAAGCTHDLALAIYA